MDQQHLIKAIRSVPRARHRVAELAELAGTSHSAIKALLRGTHIGGRAAKRIAKMLGIDVKNGKRPAESVGV